MSAANTASAFAFAVFAAPVSGLAPPGLGDLETHADDVSIDTERRELELRGHVQVEAAPFHLRSDALRLRRTGRGIEVEGKGKLAFCPCLGTPLTLSFDDALVAPPSDLVLTKPRLEIYDVPVLWLPYFWLRAPDRPGLLPPELAYRGHDGVFAGAGVHAPWSKRDRELGLDLRGGGYFKGGYEVTADLRTPSSRTRVRWDWLSEGGLSVDARGSNANDLAGSDSPGAGPRVGVAWDVDTLRGGRALRATRSLDEAARPLDRSRAEMFVRTGPITVASSTVVMSSRGTEGFDAHAGGPMASLSLSEALGRWGTAAASVRGGAIRAIEGSGGASLRPSNGPVTHVFSAADVHLGLRRPVGVAAMSADARGELAVASNGRESGRFGAARADVKAGVPLARGFGSADPADPWRHRIEPHLSSSAVVEAQAFGPSNADANASDLAVGRLPRGLLSRIATRDRGARFLIVPQAGLSTALGRWGARDGAEADAGVGVAVAPDANTRAPITRARFAASGALVGASAEAGARLDAVRGVAFTSRARVGRSLGLHLEGLASGRSGVDPTLARVLSPAMREVPSAYFAGDGFSAGGTLVVPWTRHVTTRGGADVDLGSGTLLGVRGSVDLRDGCGCVTLRLFGSERIGREGIDVWLALELVEERLVPSAKN